MAKAVKKAAKKAVSKQSNKVVRSAATVQARAKADPETALFEVLTPFKFQGAVVKPPAWIETTAAEAEEYQDAGVLGTEPGQVPAAEEADEVTDDSGDNGGANDGAAPPAAQ